MALPVGYRLLEYIESTGTQYIDTGVTYSSSNAYVIEAECCFVKQNSYSGWNGGGIFGDSAGYWDCGASSLGLKADVLSEVELTIQSGTSSQSIMKITQNGVTQSRGRAHASIATYAKKNYPIFAYTNDTGGLLGYASMKLTYLKITVNGTLVRDFVPCVDSSGRAGLYDNVGGKFYANSGSGEFLFPEPASVAGYVNIRNTMKRLTGEGYINKKGILYPITNSSKVVIGGALKSLLIGIKVEKLPAGYTKLQYIQSSGTQHIDTGFKPNSNTRVLMDYESLTSGVAFVFGSRHNSSANSTSYAFAFVNLNSNSVRSDFGSVESSITGTVLKRVILDKDKNTTTYDGTTVTAASQTFSSSYNLYLCSVNTAGAAGAKASMRIYSCQIYDNGTLVRDFVPCKNPSGAAGLYDLVNDKFYGNNGTGSFSAGAEV